MPTAHLSFYFSGLALAAFGVIVMWRAGRRRGSKRRCPSCKRELPVGSGLRCDVCEFEAEDERALQAMELRWPFIVKGVALVTLGSLIVIAGRYVRLSYDPDSALDLDPGDIWPVAAPLGLVVGLAAMYLGLFGDRCKGRRRCPKCWYDMKGAPGLRCPECGHNVANARLFYRSRRRKRVVVVGLLACALGLSTVYVPRVREGGWVSIVPTTVLITGLGVWPDSFIWDADPNVEENWTLWGRIIDGKLRSWQVEWLEERAVFVLSNSEDVDVLVRTFGLIYSWAEGADPQVAAAALPAVIAGLISSDETRQSTAAECVDYIHSPLSESGKSIVAENKAALVQLLWHPKREIAQEAAYLLSYSGEACKDVVPDLIRAMEDLEDQRRSSFGLCVVWIAAESDDAWAELTRALNHPLPAIRQSILEGLQGLETVDDHVTRTILPLLGDSDEFIAELAAVTLCHHTHRPEWVIPAILEVAERTKNPYAFFNWATTFTEDWEPHLNRLLALLDHDSAKIRTEAADTIRLLVLFTELDLSIAIPRLGRLLQDPVQEVRESAEWAIESIENSQTDDNQSQTGDG